MTPRASRPVIDMAICISSSCEVVELKHIGPWRQGEQAFRVGGLKNKRPRTPVNAWLRDGVRGLEVGQERD